MALFSEDKTTLLAGLLAVDPHRLYVYWDVSGPDGFTLRLRSSGKPSGKTMEVASSGGVYFTDLPANRSYRAEIVRGGELVLQSNEVMLPPDDETEMVATPEPEVPEEVPSSWPE